MATIPASAARPLRAHFAGSRAQWWFLACGIVGPVVFNATYLIAGAGRPGYDPMRETISALSLGPRGWIQVVNFIVFGVLIAAFGIGGLRPALRPGRGATVVPALQLTTGICLIAAGVFVMDPATASGSAAPILSMHGAVHNAASYVALTARVLGCLVLAVRFAREHGWRVWSVYSVTTALLMVTFLSALGAAQAVEGPAGLFERLATLAGSVFTVALSAQLLIGSGHVGVHVPEHDPLRHRA